MRSQQEIREHVTQLIRAGQRNQAKIWLMTQIQASDEEAESLIRALEQENPRENVVIPSLGPAATSVNANAGGCIVLVLKGVGIFFGLITLSMYVFALVMYFYFNHFTADAARVTGTVVELRENDSGSLAPVVSYEWEHQTRLYESSNYSNPPEYAVDETVMVLVNPEDPDQAIIDSFSERYLVSIIFAGIGTFFLFFTVILFIAARKIKAGFEKSA